MFGIEQPTGIPTYSHFVSTKMYVDEIFMQFREPGRKLHCMFRECDRTVIKQVFHLIEVMCPDSLYNNREKIRLWITLFSIYKLRYNLRFWLHLLILNDSLKRFQKAIKSFTIFTEPQHRQHLERTYQMRAHLLGTWPK